jgi:Holliday junction resolvase RusA-like endonuclease
MGRQRPPIQCPLPFTYWVFGRPVSVQNDDGAKPARLPAWRKAVSAALAREVAASSKDRGIVPVEDPVEVQIYWLSADPSDASQPDLDNMLKPFIDALNKTVIGDDRQVHRILAEKAPIGSPPSQISDMIETLQEEEAFARVGEVVLVYLRSFNLENEV